MRWIIGDIHGMLRPLQTLLNAVRSRDWNPHFIFVGDYVNRGPDSRGVIELLLTLRDASFVRGNHDDIFDLVLHDQSFALHPDGSDALAAFRWFTQHGMTNTLVSYGLDQSEIESTAKKPSLPRLRKLLSGVPAAHRNFIRNLPPFIEFDDLFVIHAFWDIDAKDDFTSLSGDPRLRHRLLWGRYRGEELRARKEWRRTGYFGHTPVHNYADKEMLPRRGPQIVLLDTGACLGPRGRLSAVCAETGAVVQSDPDGALVTEAA